MTTPTIKLCFFCKHCYQKAGFAYSELTYESGEAGCVKNHWSVCGDDLNLIEIGRYLIKAETCKDYDLTDEIKKDLEAKTEEEDMIL